MTADTQERTIVDAPERKRALDPGTSFIVQAPAGSGKTALLTRRVLTLLATVEQPEEILSITFTRKAAAEMRDRVVEALEAAITDTPPESAFELEGYQLARTVLERDKRLEWNLLENTDRLRMSTIDSLCSMLAQQLPVTSTLGGVANPVDNAGALYLEAARNQLKHHPEHYRCLLITVGNRFPKAAELLADMLARRDQWLDYQQLFTLENRNDLRELLQSHLLMLVEREMTLFERVIKDGSVEHLIRSSLLPLLQRATFAMDALGALKNNERESREKFSGLSEMPTLDAENLGVWQALLKCVLTSGQDGVRKTMNKNTGFPAASAKKDLDQVGITAEEAKEQKQAITDIFKALAEAPGVLEVIQQLLALPQPVYAEHQWELVDELTAHLPSLVKALHKVFTKQSSIDFTEISLRAQLALGDQDAPTDLALAMDLRLKHILVDEFQDTSYSQFNLFKKLISGWQTGDGRTFFVVGDPMQSIYLFRGAEVSLFGEAQKTGMSEDVPLEPLTLSVNFRSSPDVVNWVNDSFETIFVPEDQADATVGAIPYSASVANKSVAGSVHMHPLLDADAEEAAVHVANLVQETLASAEFAGEDNANRRIAILVRSKSAAAPIFVALQNRGIANLSIDMDSLGDQPVVMDLVSLALALRFPHSRLHWLAVLRAPWCGLGLEDLQLLTAGAPPTRSMPALISDAERIEQLSKAGRARLERFLGIMQPAIDHASRTSLVSWVESVWLQLGGPVLCAKPVDKNAAMRCLKVLYKLEAEGELWNQQLIQSEMNRLFAVNPDDGEAKVHIMTMHKSKGLEFDTVILPKLSGQSRANEQRLLNWALVQTEEASKRLFVLAPATERNASGEDKSLGRLITNLKSVSEDHESRRLLYVACTRAVRQLHLIAPLKVSKKGEIKPPARSMLEPLWPCVSAQFDEALQHHEVVDDEGEELDTPIVANPPGLTRVKEGWNTPQLPSFSKADKDDEIKDAEQDIDYLWAGRDARAIGTVVHRQMERFHTRGLPDSAELAKLAPVVQRQLQQLGVAENDCAELVLVVMEALQKVASDKTGQWLFDKSHTDARAEWALTTCDMDKLEKRVIDRTFIDEQGTRWIVDFKTGNHKGGDLEGFLTEEVNRYGDQLRRYAEILCSFESKPVKLALYFPLLQAFREVSAS